jgi:hypothetical protein
VSGEFQLRPLAGVDVDSSESVRIQMVTRYCSFSTKAAM